MGWNAKRETCKLLYIIKDDDYCGNSTTSVMFFSWKHILENIPMAIFTSSTDLRRAVVN